MKTQKAQLKRLQEQLNEAIEERGNLDISNTNLANESEYDSWLDELGEVNIGGLTYSTSFVLSQIDPIAYNCGYSDYLETLDIEDSEEYQKLTEKIEDLESEIKDLESEKQKQKEG